MYRSILHNKQTFDISRQYNLCINSYPASLSLIIHADLREFVSWIWAQLLLATAIYINSACMNQSIPMPDAD